VLTLVGVALLPLAVPAAVFALWHGTSAIGARSSADLGPIGLLGQGRIVLLGHPIAGRFRPDRRRFDDCGKDLRCWEQAFGNLAFRRGPANAIRVFERRMRTDSSVFLDCHRIAHTIGSAALARFHGDIAEAFARGSSVCASGYYHGILERAFVGLSTRRQIAAAARRLCLAAHLRRDRFLRFQCLHGLGHGLMIQSGDTLPFALSICDELHTVWQQRSCYGGAFMENFFSVYGVRSRWLNDRDLLYPCDAVSSRYKEPCYEIVTSRVLSATGYDWVETARICGRADRPWVDTCFHSYGRDAAGFSRQDPALTLDRCRQAEEYAAACIFGAAREITNNDADARNAGRLCALAPGNARAYCYYAVGTILASLLRTPQRRRDECMRLSRPYGRFCVRGAESPS
jgi:hypothetical protein